MDKSFPPGQYGDVSGYHPKELTNKDLGRFRTGLHAGNPANMVLLVQEIDRLRALEKKTPERLTLWERYRKILRKLFIFAARRKS